jgi:hypothetical protein
MGSRNSSHSFDPLDLEILDRVYQAAWAQIEARDLYRDPEQNGAREDALRKAVFNLADSHPVDFDAVYDRVFASLTARPGD